MSTIVQEQRMLALAKGNAIRSRRAELKRDVKHGRENLVPLLEDPPEWLLSAKVFDLLLAYPKMGRVKAQKLLRGLAVSPSRSVRSLTARQRLEIAAALRTAPHA